MAQPKSRLPLILGLTAAGGVGYYLYSAGGSPKVAEKQFESTLLSQTHQGIAKEFLGDISRASAKIKSEIPGRGTEAKKEGEKWASEAGAKVDSAVSVPFTVAPFKVPKTITDTTTV